MNTITITTNEGNQVQLEQQDVQSFYNELNTCLQNQVNESTQNPKSVISQISTLRDTYLNKSQPGQPKAVNQ